MHTRCKPRVPNLSKRLCQGCGIKGCLPTYVIQGISPFISGVSLWEALSVVS